MGRRAFSLLALGVFSVLFASAAQAAERLAVAPVRYREVAQTYSAEGVVEAARQSTVSAQIAGRVKEINFDVGDTVKKGQVILRIDEREAAQTLAGIIVRNSILLVDFVNLQLRDGVALQQAVIAAAGARAKPIILTELAAMLGALFILDARFLTDWRFP